MSVAPSGRIPLAVRFTPERLYYGWVVAIGCALLMFVGVGVGYYGLAVYISPLKEEHGWSTTAVSGATGLYFSIGGLTAAIIGGYIDRHGPFRLMFWGIIVNGIAAAAIGFVDSLWQLYLVYSVMAVAFGISSAVAVNAIMTRWFVRRRARAMSISATGVSVGGVILSPLIARMVDVGGIELAAPVTGILVIVVAIPVILFVLAWDPRDIGMKPDGVNYVPPPTERATMSDEVQLRSWRREEVVRTTAFWALLVAFLMVLMAQTGYVIHQISFLEERMGSRSEAAFALSLTAGGSIIARLIVGTFADAVDKRWLTVVLFVVQASAILLIVYFENLAMTWVLTLVFGFTIGNVYMMQSLMVGEIFGIVSFGAVFGLISFAGQVGSGGGPFFVGILEDATGGYTVPFTVTAIVTYAAALVVLFARPPQLREVRVEGRMGVVRASSAGGG